MHRPFFLLMILAALPAAAQPPAWYLLSREDGCLDLQILVRRENLPREPVSPEDFAGMMRARGEQVAVAPLPGSPPELAGKAVQVKVGDRMAPVFVTEGICRTDGRGK